MVTKFTVDGPARPVVGDHRWRDRSCSRDHKEWRTLNLNIARVSLTVAQD